MKFFSFDILQSKYTKAVGLYTIGNIFNRAIALLLLPVFTKLLSTTSYGIVSTYTSWVSIITVIVSLQLNMTLRSAWTDKRYELNSYISSVTTLMIFMAIILLVFCVPLVPVLFKSVPLILVVFCIFQSFSESVINMETQREMMAMEYVKRTLLLSIPNLTAAILGIVVLYFYPDSQYFGRIVPSVCVSLLAASILLHLFYKKGKKIVDKQNWEYGLLYSLPLIFHGLASTVLSGLDFTMVTSYKSAAETGVYSVAYTLGMAVGVVTSSMESVWIPWFTEHMNLKQKNTVNEIVKKYIGVTTLLCVCVMLCLPEVLMLFTDRSYWAGVSLIPPIVLASFIIFLYSISVDVEYYYKKTKIIAINTIIAAVVNIVLNLIFIPKYGAIAAAYTTVVSYFVSFVIHYNYAHHIDSELFPARIYLFPFLVAILGVITSSYLSLWYFRWGLTVIILSIGFIYYKRHLSILLKDG